MTQKTTDPTPTVLRQHAEQQYAHEIRQALAQNVDKIAPSVRAQFDKGATL